MIDRLVNEGVEMKRMYAMPQCSPTRSAIMTGRFAFHTGMQHWTTLTPGGTAGIEDFKTIANVMQDAGYDTHAIGKWHLGYSKLDQIPTGVGFDSYMGYLQGQCDYYNHTVPACQSGTQFCMYKSDNGESSPYGPNAAGSDFWDSKGKNNLESMSSAFGNYSMDMYESRFEKILAEKKEDSKLFVYFAEQTLHIPIEAPPEASYLENCANVKGGDALINRTVLCSMASRLDASIGRIESLLKKYGIWEDTIVWAVSDNGGMNQFIEAFPASASSNWPLRGGKTTVFEGGVRAVSFVFGGALPDSARGQKRNHLMHAVDFLPTLSSLAGVNTSKLPDSLDGLNVWDTIVSGQSLNRTELPLQIAINRDLDRIGGDVPCFGSHCENVNYTALIQWPYKLILGNPFLKIGQEDKDRGGYWTIEKYEYVDPPEAYDDVDVRLYNLEEDETVRLASSLDRLVHSNTYSHTYTHTYNRNLRTSHLSFRTL